MFRMTCACGRSLAYDERHIGAEVRCPGCGRVQVAPGPEEPVRLAPVSPFEQEEEPPLRPRVDREDERPLRRLKRDREEERPRARRKRPRRPASLAWVGWLGGKLWSRWGAFLLFFLGLGGVSMIVTGCNLGKLSDESSSTPQTLPLSQLIDKGFGNNRYVIATGVTPGKPVVPVVRISRSEQIFGTTPEGRKWEKVYVPVFPPGGGPLRAVVLSTRARDQAELDRILARPQVQGIATVGTLWDPLESTCRHASLSIL